MKAPSETWSVEEYRAFVASGGKVKPVSPQKDKTAPVAQKPEKSRLEQQFISIWENIGGQPYVEELQFIPDRQFRADFGFLDPKTGRIVALIELEGLTRQGGRHQRLSGFENDADKYFLAQMMGIPVIRLTRKIIKKPENLVLVRQFIEKQLNP